MTEEPTCDLPTAETGFTARDYRDLRQQLERAVVTRNEKATRAILSNNVNTILGALQDAVADKWQPIETAPTETMVLLYGSGGYRLGTRDALGNWRARYHGPITGTPTRWMLLPEPPAP